MSHRKPQRGFSLLEVLLALVLVGFSMTALVVAFLASGQFGVHARRRARVPLQPDGRVLPQSPSDGATPMKSIRRRAGFTLIEIMISVAILVFVMAGISTVLLKQSQASSMQSLQRDLEQSGRLAVLDLAHAVRWAGYGIAPPAAF